MAKRTRNLLRGAAHVLFTAAIAGLLVILVYLFMISPWQARWGATDTEVDQAMPGDNLVALPQDQTTRAITINAPAANIWKWLLQMGQGRGGFYSYEMLENIIGCDMHNADTISSEWQKRAVGDRVRMYPEGSGPPPYTVAQIVDGQALITGHSADKGGVPDVVTAETRWTDTWAFILQPINDSSTRLIIRSRSVYDDPVMRTIMAAVGPGYFIMERGMLMGIKERAERSSGAGSAANYTAADGWNAAFLIAALAGLVVYLFAGKWPHKLGIFPLALCLWVAVLFFGYPSLLLAGTALLVALIVLASNYIFLRTAWPSTHNVTRGLS